jgi:hypothetical protein
LLLSTQRKTRCCWSADRITDSQTGPDQAGQISYTPRNGAPIETAAVGIPIRITRAVSGRQTETNRVRGLSTVSRWVIIACVRRACGRQLRCRAHRRDYSSVDHYGSAASASSTAGFGGLSCAIDGISPRIRVARRRATGSVGSCIRAAVLSRIASVVPSVGCPTERPLPDPALLPRVAGGVPRVRATISDCIRAFVDRLLSVHLFCRIRDCILTTRILTTRIGLRVDTALRAPTVHG